MKNYRHFIVSFVLGAVLLLTSCASQPPSRFDQAQKDSTSRGASAVVREAKPGSAFNRYFPKPGGFDRVYTQEKKGFAEAKLKKGGKDIAVMAISDLANNPSAKNKFQSSSNNINGFPAVSQGSTGTAVLVGDYQVKVLSRDSSFSESDRINLLKTFDLGGLSRLK